MRAILSFGVPACISIFLLLAVNIFLVKKNADGDYIDNELRYEIINNSETSFERFLQYQEQGYLDYETIVYEGEEVIKLRNDLIISMQKDFTLTKSSQTMPSLQLISTANCVSIGRGVEINLMKPSF